MEMIHIRLNVEPAENGHNSNIIILYMVQTKHNEEMEGTKLSIQPCKCTEEISTPKINNDKTHELQLLYTRSAIVQLLKIVGIASTKTRVVVMVTNAWGHPYIYLVIVTA